MNAYVIRVIIPPVAKGYYFRGLSLQEAIEDAQAVMDIHKGFEKAMYAMYDTQTSKVISAYEKLYD